VDIYGWTEGIISDTLDCRRRDVPRGEDRSFVPTSKQLFARVYPTRQNDLRQLLLDQVLYMDGKRMYKCGIQSTPEAGLQERREEHRGHISNGVLLVVMYPFGVESQLQ